MNVALFLLLWCRHAEPTRHHPCCQRDARHPVPAPTVRYSMTALQRSGHTCARGRIFDRTFPGKTEIFPLADIPARSLRDRAVTIPRSRRDVVPDARLPFADAMAHTGI